MPDARSSSRQQQKEQARLQRIDRERALAEQDRARASQAATVGPQSMEPNAPQILDPGGEGWPEEPKVTQPETSLYGDLAGPIRHLGLAFNHAELAYRLICKRLDQVGPLDPEGEETLRVMMNDAWRSMLVARGVYLKAAERALAQTRLHVERDLAATATPGSGGAATWYLNVLGSHGALDYTQNTSAAAVNPSEAP